MSYGCHHGVWGPYFPISLYMTLHNWHDVCYEGSCSVILEDTGPILRYGLHHSAEAVTNRPRQQYENTTQLKCQSMFIVGWYQYHLSLAKPKKSENYFEILFVRSLIVNRNPINAGDANLMGQMLVGLRRKKEEVKHPIMLEKDPWVHPLRLQQR